MNELEIVSSFNPLDALESISKIYHSKQLAKVEILKIQAQTQSFNKWLLDQRKENKERRDDLIALTENYRDWIERLIDKMLQDPETASKYQYIVVAMIRANNDLATQIGQLRIKSR